MLRRLLTLKGGGGLKVTATGSGYYDMIGTVWMQEQGNYIDTIGTVALYADTPQGWGGNYFDRV